MSKINNIQPPAPPKFGGEELLENKDQQLLNESGVKMPVLDPDLGEKNENLTTEKLEIGMEALKPPTEELTDSFGEKVNPADSLGEPKKEPEPKFTHGMLINQPPAPSKEGQVLGVKAEVKKMEKDKKKDDGLPPIVMLIVHLVAIVVIGVGVFFLWKYQHDQIQVLKLTISNNNEKITDLNNQLNETQTNIQTSAVLPVFISSNGKYSFWQNVPGLTVNAAENKAVVTYGEVNGLSPTNGLVLEIENQVAGGFSLAQIVETEYSSQEDGVSKLDKRTEMLADNMGFSFVQKTSQEEKIIYFLHRETNASHYVKISYVIAASNDADYSNYEKVVMDLMQSIKLY